MILLPAVRKGAVHGLQFKPHGLLQRSIERLFLGRRQRNPQQFRDSGSHAEIRNCTEVDACAEVTSGCDKQCLHLGVGVAVAVATCKGIDVLREWTVLSSPEGVT